MSNKYWDVRLYGFETFMNMEKEEKGSAGFDNCGTLVVATDKEVEDVIKTGIALATAAGYRGDYLTDPDEIRKIIPDLSLDGVLGAGWTADDGYFDATMASNTYVKKMRANGATVLTGTRVEKVNSSGGRVTGLETSKGNFDFDVIVDASGPWTRFTGKLAGLDLPIWHTKAEAFFLAPPKKKLDYRFPVLKYPGFMLARKAITFSSAKRI